MNPSLHHIPRSSWWRRRIVDPLARQLTQGLSPERLSLALAFGGVVAVNPFLGTTTVACFAAGVALRLNQPALQIANLLGAPLQLVLLVPWVRAGEWLYRSEPMPLNPALLVEQFLAAPGQFLERFGTSGVHAATAWLIATPLLGAALYFALRPLLRALSNQLARGRALSPP